MAQPGTPAGRHLRGVGLAVIDDPAALGAHIGVDRLGLDIAVVLVAELVRANELPLAPGEESGADGLSVPPGEELGEKLFHAAAAGGVREVARNMAAAFREVQPSDLRKTRPDSPTQAFPCAIGEITRIQAISDPKGSSPGRPGHPSGIDAPAQH